MNKYGTQGGKLCDLDINSPEWHELDRLARRCGYGSARTCANDTGQWDAPVDEFREFLIAQLPGF